MKKVVYISWTRADYWLLRNYLLELNNLKNIDLHIIVTWMHLSSQYGLTVQNIIEDWLKIHKVYSNIDWDDLLAMTQSVGVWIIWISQKISDLKPDLVIIEWDRYEALAWAISASHQNIPIIHQWWWDIGSSIDNKIRFAISALSDFHFVWNRQSYERLKNMGYENIFNFWEPWLDDIVLWKYTNYDKLKNKYNLNWKYVLFVFHPNTLENKSLKNNLEWVIKAIKEISKKYEVKIIGSNSDAWWNFINNELKNIKNTSFINSVNREDFLWLLKNSYFMLWNSSAWIVEAPGLKKFVINIWTRQEWRLRWNNIIDVDYNFENIIVGINLVEEKIEKNEEKYIDNPYYNWGFTKKAIEKTLDILKNI